MSHRKHNAGAPPLDAANLAGITTLMNPQNVKLGMDLSTVEKTVMGKTSNEKKRADVDPVKLYTTELNQLADELGIDLMDGGSAAAPQSKPYAPPPSKS